MCDECNAELELALSRHPAGSKLRKEVNMVATVQYIRKPFFVDAVQVTAENIADVAKWCEGKVVDDEGSSYVKVRVKRPLAERQTRAFVGDWVLSSGKGFKVYTQASFDKNFESVEEKITLTHATNEQLELLIDKLEEKLGL